MNGEKKMDLIKKPHDCENADLNDDEDICQKCCEHSDIEEDERCCLICGADLTEELMGRAEHLAGMDD